MVLPRRFAFLPRNRYLFLVPLLFLVIGLLNMYETFSSTSSPADLRMIQNRAVPNGEGRIESEFDDVAPLPEEKSGFKNPVKPVAKEVDLDQVYKKRRDQVCKICKQMEIQPRSVETWATQMRKVKPLNITMCPLPQASGTFQKALEVWLRSKQTARSSIVVDKIRYEKSLYQYKVNSPLTITAFKTVLNQTMKVLFTQDPYSQLFQFYVDNILMPRRRTLDIRRNILQMRDQHVSQMELECAHNITFKDFFLFFLYHKDQLPISSVVTYCDVCGINFDVIGKEDTLVQDIKYVYNKIKEKTTTSSQIEDFGQEIAFHRIQSYITTAVSERDDMTCISPHVVYKRLWRQLQIWGYISKDIVYPFTQNASTTLDEASLSNAVLKAHHSSTPASAANREEAMSQAYMDIALRELHQGRAWFEQDFFLFGYQDRPAILFFKQGPQYDFNYFDIVPLRE